MNNYFKRKKEEKRSKKLKLVLIEQINSILNYTYISHNIASNVDLLKIKTRLDDPSTLINDFQYEVMFKALEDIKVNIKKNYKVVVDNRINKINNCLDSKYIEVDESEEKIQNCEEQIVVIKAQVNDIKNCLDKENNSGLEIKERINETIKERDSFINKSEHDYILLDKKVNELTKMLNYVNKSIKSYKNRLGILEKTLNNMVDIQSTLKDGKTFKECLNLVKDTQENASYFDLDNIKSDVESYKLLNDTIQSSRDELNKLMDCDSEENLSYYEDDDSLRYQRACEEALIREKGMGNNTNNDNFYEVNK